MTCGAADNGEGFGTGFAPVLGGLIVAVAMIALIILGWTSLADAARRLDLTIKPPKIEAPRIPSPVQPPSA